jgi:7-carboxy-7-deazaguanine synthase
MSDRAPRLRLTEIYVSIQGESTHVGRPCVFVRTTGCNLRCTWCDSAFTFSGGEWWSLGDIFARVDSFGIRTVEVTGGEPLLQPGVVPLMEGLLARGYRVLLETSGSLPIDAVPAGVHVILDLKAPDSGEVDKNHWPNLDLLRPHHEVKFVLASRRDFEWARDVVRQRALADRCEVLFSPAWGLVSLPDLASWILEEPLPVRYQLQLHKVVWEPDARGV